MEKNVGYLGEKFVMPKGLVHRIGCHVSATFADLAAHPLAQLGLLIICMIWFAVKLPVEVLTAALSILAITLTQMVLNKQNEREVDAHRRDVALHAKLDELVIATSSARDEIAGIENLEEEEIERLKNVHTFGAITPRRKAGKNAEHN